jgi:hypothetical protein
MNVRELIERLEQEDPEMQVHIAHNSGDYWHTVVAPKVNRVEELPVKRSEYHQMPVLVDGDDEVDGTEISYVVVLS